MERMSTRRRQDLKKSIMRASRIVNGHLKRKERLRREARLKDLVVKGPYPYTPTVMSWLSEKLGKPSSEITEQEARTAVGA